MDEHGEFSAFDRIQCGCQMRVAILIHLLSLLRFSHFLRLLPIV